MVNAKKLFEVSASARFLCHNSEIRLVSRNFNRICLSTGHHHTADFKYSYPTKVIFTIAMSFTFLVAVLGNSFVIYVITKNHSMRTSTNCLITNLAVCDFLITVLQTPNFIRQFYIGDTWLGSTVGNVTCRMMNYVGSVLLFCSIFSLDLIAIDRFLAVTRPLTYKLSSKWVVKIGISATWLISALLPIKSALPSNVVIYTDEGSWICDFNRSSRSFERYSSVFCLVGSLVVLTVLYSIIGYRLWRRNVPGEVSSNQQALAVRTARKVTVLMITIVIVFFVSWAPVFVFFLLPSSPDISPAIQYPFLFAFTFWLVLNSSACNPCLYFIFIESFRESLKATCSRCRAPKLKLCRMGQERRLEIEEAISNRQALNVLSQEEGAMELTAYSTANHKVAPI